VLTMLTAGPAKEGMGNVAVEGVSWIGLDWRQENVRRRGTRW
jgi:hypothetical protein